MAGAVLYTNLIDSTSTLTPSTEDAAYPVENIYDRQAANVFRCTSTTSMVIEIDLGSAKAANAIALINHNLTASATITLANADTSPSTSVTTPAYRANDIWKAFTLTSARYWVLTITDTNDVVLQIGQLLLGVRVALPVARRIGSYSPALKRANLIGETYAGNIFAYPLFERRQFNPSFRVGSASDLAVFSALDAAVCGNLYPFVYIPESSGVDCYYVRKDQDYEPQEISRLAGGELAHDYQMTLIEESRGLEVLDAG